MIQLGLERTPNMLRNKLISLNIMERINKIISTAIEKSEESKFILGFIEGAKWADNNQFFIDVNDDLPCNHKEYLDGEKTCNFLVAIKDLYYDSIKYTISHMFKINNEWKWSTNYEVIYWKQIPKII